MISLDFIMTQNYEQKQDQDRNNFNTENVSPLRKTTNISRIIINKQLKTESHESPFDKIDQNPKKNKPRSESTTKK